MGIVEVNITIHCRFPQWDVIYCVALYGHTLSQSASCFCRIISWVSIFSDILVKSYHVFIFLICGMLASDKFDPALEEHAFKTDGLCWYCVCNLRISVDIDAGIMKTKVFILPAIILVTLRLTSLSSYFEQNYQKSHSLANLVSEIKWPYSRNRRCSCARNKRKPNKNVFALLSNSFSFNFKERMRRMENEKRIFRLHGTGNWISQMIDELRKNTDMSVLLKYLQSTRQNKCKGIRKKFEPMIDIFSPSIFSRSTSSLPWDKSCSSFTPSVCFYRCNNLNSHHCHEHDLRLTEFGWYSSSLTWSVFGIWNTMFWKTHCWGFICARWLDCQNQYLNKLDLLCYGLRQFRFCTFLRRSFGGLHYSSSYNQRIELVAKALLNWRCIKFNRWFWLIFRVPVRNIETVITGTCAHMGRAPVRAVESPFFGESTEYSNRLSIQLVKRNTVKPKLSRKLTTMRGTKRGGNEDDKAAI